MDYKKSFLLFHIGLWTGLAISVFAYSKGDLLWTYLGLIVLVTSVLQTLWYYRCPQCGKRLNIRKDRPDNCTECGYPLNEKKTVE